MGYFALLTLLMAAIGLFLLIRIFSNFQPGKSRIKADLAKMKADMDKWAGELVPLTREEVELFSFNQEKRAVRKGITRTVKGVFTSIYHEPVLAYSYKEYLGPGRNALLYARANNREYVYHIRKNKVELTINGQYVGDLKENKALYGGRSKRMLAQINREAGEFLPVIVNNREVASVARMKTEEDSRLGQRAFEFVKDDMSKEEKDAFLSLAVLEVVEQSLKK